MRALVACLVIGIAGHAAADVRPLPFSHSTDTVVPGELEMSQIVDVVPLRAEGSAGETRVLATAFQAELEVGVLDRLELALGFTFAPDASVEDVGTGLRQRAKYLIVQPGEWWYDAAVIAEVSEHARGVELESRFVWRALYDRAKLVLNVGTEYAFYFGAGEYRRESVFLSSLASTYEIVPELVVGAEAWHRARTLHDGDPMAMPGDSEFVLGPHIYAGPVVQVTLGKLGVTVGGYTRLTQRSHDLVPGEPYGRFWVRAMLGYDL